MRKKKHEDEPKSATPEATETANEPPGPSADELRELWETSRKAEAKAAEDIELARLQRREAEHAIGKRLAAAAARACVKGAVVEMPDGITYKAVFKDDRYSLVRVNEHRKVSFD